VLKELLIILNYIVKFIFIISYRRKVILTDEEEEFQRIKWERKAKWQIKK